MLRNLILTVLAIMVATSVQAGTAKATDIGLAVVHEGEGVEHAFIRQLESSPQSFGFSGDTSNPKAVTGWAGHEAHILAIKLGYIDKKFGAEIRVSEPDKFAYILNSGPDGISVDVKQIDQEPDAQGQVWTMEVTGPDVATPVRIVATQSITSAQFLGYPGHESFQKYEYLYTGA